MAPLGSRKEGNERQLTDRMSLPYGEETLTGIPRVARTRLSLYLCSRTELRMTEWLLLLHDLYEDVESVNTVRGNSISAPSMVWKSADGNLAYLE